MKKDKRIIKSILLLVFSIIIFGSFHDDKIYAGTDFSKGSNGGNPGCGSGYCYHGTTGFRLTIVEKSTGKRCRYDPATNEMCTDNTGPGTIESKSVDFWFDTDGLWGINSSICKAYNKKKTKAEFLTTKRAKVVKCTNKNAYDDVYQFTYLGLPGANSNKYHAGWWKGTNKEYHNTPYNIRRVQNYLECIQEEKAAKKQDICKDKTGHYMAVTYTPFNRIFNTLFYGDRDGKNGNKINVKDLTNLDNTRIQFEQLIQIYNSANGSMSFNAVGTVVEALDIYIYRTTSARWCVNTSGTRNGGKTNIPNDGGCNGAMINGGYFNGWSANEKVGSGTLKLSKISESTFASYQTKDDPDNYMKKNTANIFNLWLKSMNPCDKELRAALKDSKKSDYDDLKNKYPSMWFVKNYSYEKAKFFYDNNKKLQSSLSCNSKLTCAQKATAIYTKCGTGGSCNIEGTALDYETALAVHSVSDSDATDKVNNFDKSLWNPISMTVHRKVNANYFPTSCKNASCQQSDLNQIFNAYKSNYKTNTEYISYVEWLYENTGRKYPLLITDTWKAFGDTKPTCTEPPNCDPSDPPASLYNCGDNVTFSDYAYGEDNAAARRCWQSGYSFTGGTGGAAFSVSNVYSNGGCNIYCSNRVTFSLPNSNISVKAGTVFKWGLNSDKSDSKFGTMKVERSCTVSNSSTSSCKHKYMSYSHNDWAKSVGTASGNIIQTQIKINYEEPTSTALNRSELLNTKYESSSGSFSVYCLDDTCSNSSIYTMQGNYTFNYQDNLKWYSNKIDGSMNTLKDLTTSSANLNYYYEIGYGLPTSFTTPSGEYSKESPTYSGATKVGKGKLEAHITKIGIKGSFDSLTVGAGGVKYSCSFNIDNELFSDECEYDDTTGDLIDGSPVTCDPNIDDVPEGDPNKVDVVFRTVDLIDNTSSVSKANGIKAAFPGRLGNGTRAIGYNWWDGIATTDTDRTNIVASVLNSNVYAQPADYHINLDVHKIQTIRKINKNLRDRTGEDPYTKMEELSSGFSDSNIDETKTHNGYYCIKHTANPAISGDEDYTFCASEFLSALQKSTWLEGDCLYGAGSTSGRAAHYAGTKGCNN